MHTLHISFDLHRADGRDYQRVYSAIDDLAWGSTCRPVESTWLVESLFDQYEFLDLLVPHLHALDQVIVTEVDRRTGFWSKGLSCGNLTRLKAMLTPVAPQGPGFSA